MNISNIVILSDTVDFIWAPKALKILSLFSVAQLYLAPSRYVKPPEKQ